MPEQYQSALTGPQMDQALLDMANHTSERYAKGTANGAAVPSGTAGYHDNALYYKDLAANQAQTATNAAGSATNSATAASTSEANATTAAGTATSAATTATQQADRAEDAADRAEAIVGGQFVSYGQDQGLTATQQAQARKNIAAALTNPNLLDNPWFTVNQRAATSYTANGYTVDRWKKQFGSMTIAVSDSGLTLTPSNQADFRQYLPSFPPTGTPVTVSVRLQDGTVYSHTSTGASTNTNIINGWQLGFNRADKYVSLYATSSATAIAIRAMKLEVGAVSTLANDARPNYAEELLKCQFDCIQMGDGINVGMGVATSTTQAVIVNVTGARRMRRTPDIEYTASYATLRTPSGAQLPVTGMEVLGNETGITIRVTVANGLTVGELVRFVVSSGYIRLTADL